jgi:ribonuclease Z
MSEITVKILGTTAGVPTRERAHTSIYLKFDHGPQFACLFDCGEGTQRQLLMAGINIMKLDHIFITHWHGDHCLGLAGLIDTMGFEGRNDRLFIHAPEISKMKRCIGLIYPMGKFRVEGKNVRSKGCKVTDVYASEDFRVASIPVKHSIPAVAYAFIERDKVSIDPKKIKTLGLPEKGEFYRELKEKGSCLVGERRVDLEDVSVKLKGRKVVYSGDTEVCDNLREIARGADILIQDCTYMEDPGSPKPHSHASLPEVMEMVESLNIKKVVLTHISRKYRSLEELHKMTGGHPSFTIAEDFYTLAI